MTLDDLRASRRATLTITDVAGLLEVDERTVRRACEEGQLPCIRVGRRLLIPREPLLSLLTAPHKSDGALATSTPSATAGPDQEARPHGDTPQLRSA